MIMSCIECSLLVDYNSSFNLVFSAGPAGLAGPAGVAVPDGPPWLAGSARTAPLRTVRPARLVRLVRPAWPVAAAPAGSACTTDAAAPAGPAPPASLAVSCVKVVLRVNNDDWLTSVLRNFCFTLVLMRFRAFCTKKP